MIIERLKQNPSYLQLAINTFFVLFAIFVARFLLQGLKQRWRFIRMKRGGLPVPEPYSLLLGHMSLMQKVRKSLPSDAHSTYTQVRIVLDWKIYFPSAPKCPPLVYLDFWPFMSQPIIMITSPEGCAQLTQDTPQPRHDVFRWSLFPLTQGLDLISLDMANHARWRQRLLPAFSSRNIESNIDAIVDRVEIFADKLKAKAANGPGWSDVFPLYDMTVSLTFDIIAKFAVGLDLDEQRNGPTDLVQSMRYLMAQVKQKTLINSAKRLLPRWRANVTHHRKMLQSILLPQIKSIQRDIANGSSARKTIMHYGLKEFEDGSSPSNNFIESILSNTKILLFAGHDTTAQTLCWVYRELCRCPDALQAVREEHSSVFGTNLKQTQQLIRDAPSKLNQLPYTTAVIKETLRLHNLASTFRAGSKEFNLLLEGISYPTCNSVIQTMPGVMHLRDDYWPRAMEFLPQRFLVPEGNPLQPLKNVWRPFELGNTRCIGQELAMIELKTALILTLRNLNIQVDQRYLIENDQKNIGKGGDTSTSLDTIYGDALYRVGYGIGHVKANLPIRVAWREEE